MTKSPDPSTSGDPTVVGRSERPPRHNVLLSAVVERFGGGPPTSHRVRDLSAGGVRIDQAANLRIGATVLISVGSLQAVGATVVWLRDGSAGLKFVEPVEPDEARAKAMIAPRTSEDPARLGSGGPKPAVQAGWMPDLRSPYRR